MQISGRGCGRSRDTENVGRCASDRTCQNNSVFVIDNRIGGIQRAVGIIPESVGRRLAVLFGIPIGPQVQTLNEAVPCSVVGEQCSIAIRRVTEIEEQAIAKVPSGQVRAIHGCVACHHDNISISTAGPAMFAHSLARPIHESHKCQDQGLEGVTTVNSRLRGWFAQVQSLVTIQVDVIQTRPCVVHLHQETHCH